MEDDFYIFNEEETEQAIKIILDEILGGNYE